MSEAPGFFRAYGWSPNGNTLIFDYAAANGSGGNIGILSITGQRSWKPLLQTEASEVSPALSLNGAWIAYASNQTVRLEVYVERFPDLGERKKISTDGGVAPLWSPDGHELFYQRGSAVMAVPIAMEPFLSVGSPRVQ